MHSKSSSVRRTLAATAAVGLSALCASVASAAILYNPVVTLVGDGTAADMGGQGKTTTIQIYDNTQPGQASPISQLAYNSGSGTGNMLINSVTGSTEAELSNNPAISTAAAAGQSYSGTTYVYSAGYNTANDTEAVQGSGSTGPARAVGYMNATGSALSGAAIPVSVADSAIYDGNNIRSATGDDAAANYWTAGNSTTSGLGGWRYANMNVKVTTTASANCRSIEILNGRLFGSSADKTGIYMIGSPPPTNSGNTAMKIFDTGKNSDPNEFAFIDDGGGGTGDVGGISKFVWNGTAWSKAYTLTDGATGDMGLAAQLDPTTGKVVLWTTTVDGTKLEQVTDTGASSAFTTLATAPTNDVFRGVALSSVVPEPTSLAMIALSGVALIARKRKR
jgi:hypothetical protein